MPFHGYDLLIYILLLIIFWLSKDPLYEFLNAHLPVVLGAAAFFLLFSVSLPLIELAQRRAWGQAWRRRLEEREGLSRRSPWRRILLRLGNSINHALNPLFGKGLGRQLLGFWRDAGFGSQPLSLLSVMAINVACGAFLGYLVSGRLLLSGFVASLFLVGLLTLAYSRSKLQRRLFQDQFPGVLDRLADSLQAGFSLPQAVEFVVPNLSQPSSTEMQWIADQIEMGFTVDQALKGLYERRTNEDVRLLVEGLTLQRQVGGNMAAMMREMAQVVRTRVELENEVRTLTAQGRLSAVVIALLVPVSLALLTMFPGYVDVLFNTTIGNMVLILAGMLELVGAVIVARLIRIEV